MSREERSVRPQPPEELTGIAIEGPKEVGAGIPAVLSTLGHLADKPGLVKGARLVASMNQPDGFDCSSCAWPDPDQHRSLAEFCENGAKAVADEGTRRTIGEEFFARFSVGELSHRSDYWLNRQGRLVEPLVLESGSEHYRPIGWSEAFQMVAEELKALSSPDQAVFYTSGRTSNEAAFLYQLFVRAYGTNNLPDCSNMCHESSGFALSTTIGIGKGTVTLEDFYQAEVIFILGQNPGTNHPRMLSALERAKHNGAKIVSINPLPETGLIRFKNPQDFMNPLKALGTLLGPGTSMADLHLPVRINGDVALLKGILKEMLEREERLPGTVVNADFVEAQTEGFEALIEDLRNESWDVILEQSGVARDQIREAAELAARSQRIICCWAMGLTQHKNAVANIQQVVNLLLLRGSIGKPGAGACPVRGHSNVQGDRTMGIWERPSQAFLDALEREFNFSPPRHHGYDTVNAIRALQAGKAQVFFALGGNFLSATPDTEATAAALQKCSLTVQVSTKLNRSHLVTGKRALILPCLGRSERDVQKGGVQFQSCENSMGVVQKSQGMLTPAAETLKSEVAIVAGLAEATLGPTNPVDWAAMTANYDQIREAIARVVPGFEDYNRRVRLSGGFYLPNGPREGRFPTPTGKAQFTVHPIPRHHLGQGRYLMMTIRSHDQFNTTIYGLDDRYRGIKNERRVLFMNRKDLQDERLETGQIVDITSHFHDRERIARRFVVVAFPIPRGCAASYFPETNVLVPLDLVAEKSNTPASKSIEISIQPHQPPH